MHRLCQKQKTWSPVLETAPGARNPSSTKPFFAPFTMGGGPHSSIIVSVKILAGASTA